MGSLLIHLYGFISLHTRLLLNLFIHWSSPLLFNKLLIIMKIYALNDAVSTHHPLLDAGRQWDSRPTRKKGASQHSKGKSASYFDLQKQCERMRGKRTTVQLKRQWHDADDTHKNTSIPQYVLW
jgi:hypothetical protein